MPEKRYTEVAKDKIDRIVTSGNFDVPSPLGPGTAPERRFFIFRWPGDTVEGYLGKAVTNHRRNSSYPVETEKGVIEIFANKLLHTIIRDNELVGSLVKIVMVGYRHVPHVTRAQKIYRVYKIAGSTEIPCIRNV